MLKQKAYQLLKTAKTKAEIGYAIDHLENYHPAGLYWNILSKPEMVAHKVKMLAKYIQFDVTSN